MYITARERQILEILLSSEKEMTVKDLANAIDVSTRTIHRDLNDVEDTLARYNLKLIKKSGVGVQLIGEKENIEHLKLFLFNVDHNQFTADERQTIILCTLLEAVEPVKLIALANELNVTIATVSNDLNKVEERLQPFPSLLLIRRRGYGVEIAGDETAKRKAMSKVITENVDEYELLSLIRESIQKKNQHDPISERLLGLVEKKNLHIVERAVDEINKELSYSIADSAYMGLVVHLALAMERILRGENITIDPLYLQRLEEKPEYQTAEKIIEKLEKVYQTEIPKAEIGYITMHLRGAKLRQDKEYFAEDSAGLQDAVKAKSLIGYVEKRVHQPLSESASLLQGLVAHLGPALFRIKQNMGISNPLLGRIKEEYSELFSIIKEGVEVIFPDLEVPEEEIGYLVMHFGSVLLNIYQRKPLKALVVCSTGIGTSKMLATRLQKEIPDIKICKNVSLFELNQMATNTYDLIISTIRLPEMEEGAYFIVNPILTEAEVDQIKRFIYKKHKSKIMEIADKPLEQPVQPLLDELGGYAFLQVSHYAKAIGSILDDFFVIKEEQPSTIAEALRLLVEREHLNGGLEHAGVVLDDLQKREKQGGLGIPGTKLALFHAKSAAVKRPSFSICPLHKPCITKGMDNSDQDVTTILLLLAPEQAGKEALEVLSYISASIIESERVIAHFESQDAGLLAALLTTKLNQFFVEKLSELRRV